jgi:hypothetical protein
MTKEVQRGSLARGPLGLGGHSQIRNPPRMSANPMIGCALKLMSLEPLAETIGSPEEW